MNQNQVGIVRNVLKTHRIHANKHESLEKCTGCTWIGWHHVDHVAGEINSVLVEEFTLCQDECSGTHYHHVDDI